VRRRRAKTRHVSVYGLHRSGGRAIISCQHAYELVRSHGEGDVVQVLPMAGSKPWPPLFCDSPEVMAACGTSMLVELHTCAAGELVPSVAWTVQ
jgi:hypothetical protein